MNERLLLAIAVTAGALGCVHQSAASQEGDQRASEAQPSEPPNPAAAKGLYDRGETAYGRGDLPHARQAYAELTSRFPADSHADDAKRRMAEIDLKERHYGDAEQSLKSLYAHTSAAERPQAARALAEAAEGAGDAVEAVRDGCEWAKLDPSARDRATVLLDRVVEKLLSADDAARLASDLPSDCPAQELIAFKRALTLAHIGDPQAPAALEDAIARYPQSPAAGQARIALEQLRALAAQGQKPGVIGLLVPQTPDSVGAYGKAAVEGLKLGLGDGVTLIVRDTHGDPAEAKKAVDDLAAQGVQAIVGPILPNEAEAAAVRAQELGIPIVTLTKVEGITRVGTYVFRNMLTDSAQARALAHYAVDIKGYKRFAVLYPDLEYGKEMMSLFWDQVEAKGGRFRGAVGYPFDTTTFSPFVAPLVGRADLEMRRDFREGVHDINEQNLNPVMRKKALRKLKENLPPLLDFEAIFIADSARNVALVAPALASENIHTDGCDASDMRTIQRTTGHKPHPIELLGWTAWSDPDFDLVQQAGRTVECSVYVDGFFAQSARPETQAFVKSFQDAYGRMPGIIEAEAYDTGRLVREALKGQPQTRDAFRDAFAALRAVKAATGDSTVGPNREVEKPLFFVTITNKGYQELDLSKVQPAESPDG